MTPNVTPRQVATLLLTALRNVRMRALGGPGSGVRGQRTAAQRQETSVHKAADAHLSAMTLAVRAAFGLGRKALGKPPDAARAAKAVHDALLKVLPKVLASCFAAGGNAGAAMLPKRLKAASLRTLKPQAAGQPHDVIGPYGIAFNVNSPEAIAWAQQHAAELAKGLSETTRDDIKQAIADAMAGGGLDEAYDDILAAVGDPDRAELIARSESMMAANEGNRASMTAAVDAGLLPSNVRIEWIASPDACDDCLDLDGETRDIDGEYPGDGGDGPILHPRCRCTEGVSAESGA